MRVSLEVVVCTHLAMASQSAVHEDEPHVGIQPLLGKDSGDFVLHARPQSLVPRSLDSTTFQSHLHSKGKKKWLCTFFGTCLGLGLMLCYGGMDEMTFPPSERFMLSPMCCGLFVTLESDTQPTTMTVSGNGRWGWCDGQDRYLL